MGKTRKNSATSYLCVSKIAWYSLGVRGAKVVLLVSWRRDQASQWGWSVATASKYLLSTLFSPAWTKSLPPPFLPIWHCWSSPGQCHQDQDFYHATLLLSCMDKKPPHLMSLDKNTLIATSGDPLVTSPSPVHCRCHQEQRYHRTNGSHFQLQSNNMHNCTCHHLSSEEKYLEQEVSLDKKDGF